MVENIREDLVEYNRLNSVIKLEGMSFDKVMNLIVGFLNSNVRKMLIECNLAIDVDVLSKIQECLDIAHQTSTGGSTAAELADARVTLWNIYEAQAEGSDERRLARVTVCGLYDEDSAEYATFGSEAMFETFFSVLLDLNPNCCRRFSDYAINEIAHW